MINKFLSFVPSPSSNSFSLTVLDLKMGTRQYSDGMNSAKIARKQQRSLDTTSHGMGMRIAGIRVSLYIISIYIIYT